MHEVTTARKSDAAGYYLAVLLFAILLAGHRLSNLLILPHSIEQTLALDLPKPFVLRCLIPWLLGSLDGMGIGYALSVPLFETAAFVVALLLYRHYLTFFIADRRLAGILSFTLALVLPFVSLIPRYQPIWYAYDAWALVFMLAGLIALHQRMWWLYYPIFILATLNRETSCFLTMIMVLTLFGRIPFWQLLLHGLAQLLLWLGIKYGLDHLIFPDAPGQTYYQQYLSNWRFITDMTYEQRFALPQWEAWFRPVYLLGNFAFVWLLVIRYWNRIGSDFVARAALVLIPFTLAMLYVSNIYEYRIFGEMLPLVLTPALLIVVNLARKEAKNT